MEEIVKPSNIIGPLTFSNNFENAVQSLEIVLYPNPECQCILCDEVYVLPKDQQLLLTHLYMEHRIVIADVDQIASLKQYVDYWKPKIMDKGLAEYCSTMLLDKKPDGEFSKGEKYYLLSDIVPEDNQLRRDLQQKRLESVLRQQKAERDDKHFERECLFCRTVITDTRPQFLNHLFNKHNLYIAKTENLVFIGELIEYLSNQLDNFICIFCEKTFKDRVILKEHMRKKAHKRINPKNKEYDKFFINNYLEMGKNWQSYLKANEAKYKSKNCSSSVHSSKSKESKKESSSESDNAWSDWEENITTIICLFCKHSEPKYSQVLTHMKYKHKFDFATLTNKLNFYDKIKIVNYVRRQVHLKRCITCDSQCSGESELLSHMEENDHLTLQDHKLWNQPEFFFSTYEDDGLLYSLEDNESSDEEEITDQKKKHWRERKDLSISEEVALSVLSD